MAYVVLTCTFHKEKQKWVGICKELGTSTFANSLDKAQKKLAEAIELHVNTLEDVGERERFFKENKIIVYKTKPEKDIDVLIPPNEDYFVSPCIQELTPA